MPRQTLIGYDLTAGPWGEDTSSVVVTVEDGIVIARHPDHADMKWTEQAWREL